MERNNNTYGELINNKFSDLLSADMDTTWKEMKAILDKEIPEKKNRKWLLWFTTRTGVFAIVLFSLFASAATAYIGLSREEEKNNTTAPAKEMKNKVNIEKNEETLNTTDSGETASIKSGKGALSPPVTTIQANDKGTMIATRKNKAKNNQSSSLVKQPVLAIQKKDETTVKTITVISIEGKDSINIATATAQTEVAERRRAF